MKELKIIVELKSPALVGSAEGFGAVIDADVVFDEAGIPYIPSKRIKGCLRDSAIEVCEMLESGGINLFNLEKDKEGQYLIVNQLFGIPGSQKPAPLFISNLTVKDYESLRQWLLYYQSEYGNIVNPEAVRRYYTEIRQQTAIEDGVAKEHSLRTIRVLKKGESFEGTVLLENSAEELLTLLCLACLNLRRFGGRRNRGFGEIKCSLFKENEDLTKKAGGLICKQ